MLFLGQDVHNLVVASKYLGKKHEIHPVIERKGLVLGHTHLLSAK